MMIRFILLLFITLLSLNLYAQGQDTMDQSNVYIYVLKLTPSYIDESNWKEEDYERVGIHFNKLQEMLSEGKLIMAGRSDVENAKTFGIVVFKADSFEDAVKAANEDPAVKAGIMSVEVFPFRLALMKGS